MLILVIDAKHCWLHAATCARVHSHHNGALSINGTDYSSLAQDEILSLPTRGHFHARVAWRNHLVELLLARGAHRCPGVIVKQCNNAMQQCKLSTKIIIACNNSDTYFDE